MENEVKQMLFEKLKEMAEIKFEDCTNLEYPQLCSAMNDIAKTFIDENRLKNFSVSELIEELKSRASVEVTEQERYCIEDAKTIRLINLKVTE